MGYHLLDWGMDRYILWVVSGSFLDHAAGPRSESTAIERGQRVVDSVRVELVIGIENGGVSCLPQGIVIVNNAVTACLAVSKDTIR